MGGEAGRKGIFKNLAWKGKHTLILPQARPDSILKCLRAKLWHWVGPRQHRAGSGVGSGGPRPLPAPHLWPDTSIQPLPGHKRLPQGPGPSPVLPVESCLVASLERFHMRDPNQHRRRKPAGAPGLGAGEGVGPTVGLRQVTQPGSRGLRPGWHGGGIWNAELQQEQGGPRLRRGQGALEASSGPGTHGTPHTPHSKAGTASFQLRSQALGLLEAEPQGSGSLSQDTGPEGREGAHPVSWTPSQFLRARWEEANTRSSGNLWLTVSGLWDFGCMRPWPGGWQL